MNEIKTYDTMSPEEQRIAIAEACGWKLVMDNPLYEPYWEDPKGNKIGISCGMRFPDYLNNLNAIHDAVKTIPQNLMPRYFACLCNVVSGALSLYGYSKATEATASQRCEAFLRTIDKWKE